VKPRVLQVITHLGLGGAESVALSLIRELRPAFEFAVYAPCGIQSSSVAREMQRELRELNVPVFTGTHVEIKRGGLLIAGWKLAAAIRRVEPHLVHVHTEIPEASYAAAVMMDPRIRRASLLRTIHNSVYWTPRRWLGTWCERRMSHSHVVAVSEPALRAFEQVRAESSAGALRHPARVILNGVRVARTRTFTDARPSGPIRMLFAGRFETQKGADLLPRIVTLVKPPNDRVLALDIIGEGTFREPLRALASNPPPGWNIRVEPPAANLKDSLADYDLVLMPSRFEGLSILAMESLLSGVPIVATDAPGLRDGLPADYAWVCESGKAEAFADLLSSVLGDSEAWQGVAAGSREYARHKFDASVMCAAYAALYEEVLASEQPALNEVHERSSMAANDRRT
jgi:glycosyltransferase involved in cell wall biosynthesis